MYEVEIKIEISDKEKEKLLASLKSRGFVSDGVTPQSDVYIEAKESQYGGYDLRRYRHEGSDYIYTEKVWQKISDSCARKETERPVTAEEYLAETAKYPDAISIHKNREWFSGEYEGRAISFTIDTVKFDHSLSERYFVEAEIGIEDKNKVAETKAFLGVFLKDILGKPSGIKESPGMFTMAFKKL